MAEPTAVSYPVEKIRPVSLQQITVDDIVSSFWKHELKPRENFGDENEFAKLTRGR